MTNRTLAVIAIILEFLIRFFRGVGFQTSDLAVDSGISSWKLTPLASRTLLTISILLRASAVFAQSLSAATTTPLEARTARLCVANHHARAKAFSNGEEIADGAEVVLRDGMNFITISATSEGDNPSLLPRLLIDLQPGEKRSIKYSVTRSSLSIVMKKMCVYTHVRISVNSWSALQRGQ